MKDQENKNAGAVSWVEAAVIVDADGGESPAAHVADSLRNPGKVADMRAYFCRKAEAAGKTVQIAGAQALPGITARPDECPSWDDFRAGLFRGDPESKRGRHVAFLDEAGMPATAVEDVAGDLDWEGNEAALAEAVSASFDEAGADLVARAFALMKEAHEGQTQKRDKEPDGLDDVPYSNHPVRVALSLLASRPGVRAEAVCAALLHDVAEDTAVGVDRIRGEFGDGVADLVAAVTKGEGESREAYLARVAALAGDALDVKLADRCHNLLRALTSKDAGYVAKYAAESEKAFSPLFKGTPWENEFARRLSDAKRWADYLSPARIMLFENAELALGADPKFVFYGMDLAKESKQYNLSLLTVLNEKASWGKLAEKLPAVQAAVSVRDFAAVLAVRKSEEYLRLSVEFLRAVPLPGFAEALSGTVRSAGFISEAARAEILNSIGDVGR